jgi:peptide/nickel transport system ATP-binding protein
VAGLEPFEGGSVEVSGQRLDARPAASNRSARRLQMVYQNPLSALDPRFTVRQLLDEPIALSTDLSSADRAARVSTALDHVALPQKVLGSRPHDLSGGQRQRVAIARALALSPEVLVLDEPTSALDVTVQTQIVDLLMELRDRDELTYLFISHDLSLIRQIAEEVTVLEHGRLVEHAPTAELFAEPRDDYTRRLIAAIPQTS